MNTTPIAATHTTVLGQRMQITADLTKNLLCQEEEMICQCLNVVNIYSAKEVHYTTATMNNGKQVTFIEPICPTCGNILSPGVYLLN